MIRKLPPSTNLHIEDLVYRGEGNNTIVLSDQSSGAIYRFRKTSLSSNEEESQRQKLKLPKCLSESYNFRYHVLRHCLGSEFVSPMQLLEVPSHILERLDEQIKPDRPICRLIKSIDTSYRNVLRAPDACRMPPSHRPYGTGPIVCVEIKTKNGFIPTCPEVQNHLERTVCKFCMVQYHDKKTKLWNEKSSYCPCDLFSGQRPRMRRALKALIRSPQINFRCFLDGHLHYSCNHELKYFLQFIHSFMESDLQDDSVEDFLDVLIDGLLYEFRDPQSATMSWNEDTCYSLHCHEALRKAYFDGEILINDGIDSKTQLPIDCVLGRILNLQLRDSLGSRGIQPHLARLTKHFEATGVNWRWPMPSDKSHRDRLDEWKLDNEKLMESFRFVEEYLIALVANDCSLMLTLQKAKSNAPPHIPTICTRQGERLLLNVVVVDLDPKSFNKVSESAVNWNQEIVDTYEANHLRIPSAVAKIIDLSSKEEETLHCTADSSSSSAISSAADSPSSTPRTSPIVCNHTALPSVPSDKLKSQGLDI